MPRRVHWRRRRSVGSFALHILLAGLAADAGVMTEVCPLDGTRFERSGYLAEGATSFRLDLRPIGRLPVVEPLVRCPRCQFVPGPEEPRSEELERLRALISSPAYAEQLRGHSDHALRALILGVLRNANYEAAFEWLHASWELEEAGGAEWRSAIEHAISAFARVALAPARPRPEVLGESNPLEKQRTAKLMQVELLRRLGRFIEGHAAVQMLRLDPDLQQGISARLIALEAELIEKKDSSPQPFPVLAPLDPHQEDPAFVAALKLKGYGAVSEGFTLERSDFGNINGLPHSLHLSLRARQERPLDSVWWWNFTKDGRPQFDWHQLLATHAEAEKLVAKNPWLAEWKAGGTGRRVELQLAGLKSNTATDFDFFVSLPWQDAGFKSAPAVQLILRSSDKQPCAEVFLDQGGGGIVPIVFDGCGSTHWLTAKPFSFHPQSLEPTYLHVDRDGRWERRVVGRKQ